MFLCFPFFQKKDFNFSDAPPKGGGIQKNTLPQKRAVFVVRNFSNMNLIDSHPKPPCDVLYILWFRVYPTTLSVAPLLILYRVDSFSITIHPSDGFPEQLPPCIRNPLRPHILFEATGYNS